MPCGASATCCASRAVFPSIRAQLTAWLALLVTRCLATFAVYLYVAVGQLLTADLNQTLRVQAQQVVATYAFHAPDSGDEEQHEQRVDTSAGDQVAAVGVWAEVFERSEVLLRSPTLDPPTREGLVLIRDEAGRMGRLVADLLLLARGDADRASARVCSQFGLTGAEAV